jgi:ribonuclease HII
MAPSVAPSASSGDRGSRVAGCDEAGCGPALGSLWASAVVLVRPVVGLKDSKRLSPARRLLMREEILRTAACGFGEVTAFEIDQCGMGEARRLVFSRALDDLVERSGVLPDRIVVDGSIFRPWRDVPFVCEPKADANHDCVSAASILAKTQRDAQIDAWCDGRPELVSKYDLRSNKGYLSSRHIQGLKTFGRCDLHRTSFAVRALGLRA